jgi:hypothetical protein
MKKGICFTSNTLAPKIFFFIILLGVAMLLFLSYREPKVTMSGENFKIYDLYGITIPMEKIANVDTLSGEDIPSIIFRTKGSSLLGVNKGYFKTKDGKNVWLSIKCGVYPIIHIIDKDNKVYYLNRKNPNDTRNIFNTLTNYIKNKE